MAYVYAYVCLCEFGPRAVRIVPEFGWYQKNAGHLRLHWNRNIQIIRMHNWSWVSGIGNENAYRKRKTPKFHENPGQGCGTFQQTSERQHQKSNEKKSKYQKYPWILAWTLYRGAVSAFTHDAMQLHGDLSLISGISAYRGLCHSNRWTYWKTPTYL